MDLWDFLIYLFMKLFITNKQMFENTFDSSIQENFTSKEIHKFIYQQLFKSVSTENSIPIILLQSIDLDAYRIAEFRFKGIKDDVYFYEFYQTING